jgi:epoxyqueuosine reductase
LGSLLTHAPFEVTPRKTEDPYAYCLFYAKGICRQCAQRCPGGAITEKGHDKLACLRFLKAIEKEFNEKLGSVLKPDLKKVNDQVTTTYPVGCAFCQFGTPCMDKNPMTEALG